MGRQSRIVKGGSTLVKVIEGVPGVKRQISPVLRLQIVDFPGSYPAHLNRKLLRPYCRTCSGTI